MMFDIVLAGVGGQGVLSLAAIIGSSAIEEGLEAMQSENHGMAQRGGSVGAHLRLADRPIASTLIPHSSASMILAMEPLEGLRQLEFLSSDGVFITSITPVLNISDYPVLDDLLAQIEALPRSVLLDSDQIAKRAGTLLAANVALVGAASRYLPISSKTIEGCIEARFSRKGQRVLEANLEAYHAARAVGS
jgi:indolepyruvate ferredoxin oxidoreductase beta subunit